MSSRLAHGLAGSTPGWCRPRPLLHCFNAKIEAEQTDQLMPAANAKFFQSRYETDPVNQTERCCNEYLQEHGQRRSAELRLGAEKSWLFFQKFQQKIQYSVRLVVLNPVT